jgi:hypothetical protein
MHLYELYVYSSIRPCVWADALNIRKGCSGVLRNDKLYKGQLVFHVVMI